MVGTVLLLLGVGVIVVSAFWGNDNCDCGGSCSHTGPFFALGPVIKRTGEDTISFLRAGKIFLVWACHRLSEEAALQTYRMQPGCTSGPAAATS